MNTTGANNRNPIWKRLFIGILGIQALLELVIGSTFLLNFQVALESGFGISYTSELDILGIALGLYLLLLTSLLVLSIVWVLQGKYSGVTVGIIAGVFLTVFGLLSFLQLGDAQAIMIDSLRGIITIILGYMTGREFKKQDV